MWPGFPLMYPVMIEICAELCRGVVLLLGVLCLATTGGIAHAQGALTAYYSITMTGVAVGEIKWTAEINEASYIASASGKASGVLSVLVNGEGAVNTSGTVADGHLTPASFTSRITDDEGVSELQVSYVNGTAKEQVVSGPLPTPDRLPISDDDRRDVADPLTAFLVPTMARDDFLNTENCRRVLQIFDGRRRYNLALSPGRIDKYKALRGYNGPALVCSVVLQPVSGYKRDSTLVKYVAGRRDMELWFVPVAGTSLIAPIRVAMPTLVGTLKIEAGQFETVAAPPPSTALPAPIEMKPLAPPR